MKTTNALITLITLLVIMSGCDIFSSNNGDNKDKFEPYKIGSFLMERPDSASWKGVLAKQQITPASADTAFLSAPGDLQFSITSDTSVKKSTFTFIDSSLGELPTIFDIEYTVKQSIDPNLSNLGLGGSKSLHIKNQVATFNISASYRCNTWEKEYEPEYLDLVLKNEAQDTLIKIYRFQNTNGMGQVVKNFTCD